ncbi:MAG: DUF2946 domain-containing protein [Rhodanobacter sp.]|nr:MAG: DUF2946 domain-containing protein [Rhodanobacter sp.]
MRLKVAVPVIQRAERGRKACRCPARTTECRMRAFRRTTCSRFVGCLAFVAVWLTAVMPVISRSMPNGMGPMDPGSWGASHGLSLQHPSAPSDPSATLDKCGYCCLFCHSPLVAGEALPALPSLALSAPILPAPTVPVGPLPQRLSAAPRGPPSQA